MILFPRAESFETCGPGQWAMDREGRVWVRCPHEHGHGAIIHMGRPDPKYWEIRQNGMVSPSVWFRNADCGFHDYITLVGWEPPPAPGGAATPPGA